MPFTVIPIVNTSPLRESPWSIAGLSRDIHGSHGVGVTGRAYKTQFRESLPRDINRGASQINAGLSRYSLPMTTGLSPGIARTRIAQKNTRFARQEFIPPGHRRRCGDARLAWGDTILGLTWNSLRTRSAPRSP